MKDLKGILEVIKTSPSLTSFHQQKVNAAEGAINRLKQVYAGLEVGRGYILIKKLNGGRVSKVKVVVESLDKRKVTLKEYYKELNFYRQCLLLSDISVKDDKIIMNGVDK